MNKYFVVSEGDVRLVEWGDPEDPMNALPVVICPPAIPAEIVDVFCDTLTEKDPDGNYGKAMENYVDSEMNAEIQGLPPGEIPLGDQLADYDKQASMHDPDPPEEDITQVWEEDAP